MPTLGRKKGGVGGRKVEGLGDSVFYRNRADSDSLLSRNGELPYLKVPQHNATSSLITYNKSGILREKSFDLKNSTATRDSYNKD